MRNMSLLVMAVAMFVTLKVEAVEPPVVDVQKLLDDIFSDAHGRHKSVAERTAACENIIKLAHATSPVIGFVGSRGLRHPESAIRISAANALREAGPTGVFVLRNLVDALKDEDAGVRYAVADALVSVFQFVRVTHAQEYAVIALGDTAENDTDAKVRVRACAALGIMRAEGKLAVPSLINVLKDKRAGDVRYSAALALNRMGVEAKAAVPVLIDIYKSGEGDIKLQQQALSILGVIGADKEAAIPLMLAALRDPKKIHVREAAITGIGVYGPAAADTVPVLVDALAAVDVADANVANRIRGRIFWTLARLGRDARIALPHARKLLATNTDPSARLEAERFIKAFEN